MDAARMKGRGIAWGRRLGVRVPGWTLLFNKQGGGKVGYANLTPDPANTTTEAVLYQITLEGLGKLGGYEGFPTHYGLQPVAVLLPDGRPATAMMYIAEPEQVAPDLAPDPDYLAHLLAGGDLLSPEYLARLGAVKTRELPSWNYRTMGGSGRTLNYGVGGGGGLSDRSYQTRLWQEYPEDSYDPSSPPDMNGGGWDEEEYPTAHTSSWVASPVRQAAPPKLTL